MQVVAASFIQHYTPVADNVILSALVAALPIVVLLGLLGLLRVKAHIAALAGLGASLLVAIVVFGMPVGTAAAAAWAAQRLEPPWPELVTRALDWRADPRPDDGGLGATLALVSGAVAKARTAG